MEIKPETQELDGAIFQTNKSLSLHNKCKTHKEYSLSDNGTQIKNKLLGVKTTTPTLMQLAQSHVSAAGSLKNYSKLLRWKWLTTADQDNKA